MLLNFLTFRLTSLSHLSIAYASGARRSQTNGPKTIETRRRGLDPDLWKQKPWVIEDPGDSTEVLYLTEREYHAYNRVALSNEMTLVLIARSTTSPDLIGSVRRPSDDDRTPSSSSGTSVITPSSAKRPYHTFSFKNSPLNIRALGGFFEVGTKDRLVTLSSGKLASLFIKYTRLVYFWVYGRLTVEQLRVVLFYVKEVRHIFRYNGPSGLILRLKVSLIVITAFVAGRPKTSTFDLGCYVKLSNGLPVGLPRSVRDRIRKGDLNVIRVWLSIFNLYKTCTGKYGSIPLDTIQAPPLQNDISPLLIFFQYFFQFQNFIPKRLLNARDALHHLSRGFKLPRSVKAGPNEKISYKGAMADAIAWLQHPKMLSYILYFVDPMNVFPYLTKSAIAEKYDTQSPQFGQKSPEDYPGLSRQDPRVRDPFWKVRDCLYITFHRIYHTIFPTMETLAGIHTLGVDGNITFDKFKSNFFHPKPLVYFGMVRKNHPDKWPKDKVPTDKHIYKSYNEHNRLCNAYNTAFNNPKGYRWGGKEDKHLHFLTPDQAKDQARAVLLRDCNRLYPSRLAPVERLAIQIVYSTIHTEEKLKLGKLSVIHEAAGKNRIIAINDYWSQCILKLLHEYLFKILPSFSGDATFDQEGTLRKFTERNDISYHASYDLSSATDLVPTALYRVILEPIFGSEFTSRWLGLLTDKVFHYEPSSETRKKVAKRVPLLKVRHKLLPLRYTRGQPMGAYSSWGLLALAHHMCVQVCFFFVHFRSVLSNGEEDQFYTRLSPQAKSQIRYLDFHNRVKEGAFEDTLQFNLVKGFLNTLELVALIPRVRLVVRELIMILFSDGLLPFDKYVVLGDDIVIGDKAVGDIYYNFMNFTLGVPIKLAKSFVSDKGLINFANQTYLGKSNISPIPSKEASGADTVSALTEFSRRIVRRWSTNPYDILMKIRLMVKPSVYIQLVTALAIGKVPISLMPLCLHLNVSSATVGLNRSKAGQSLNPERTPYGVALGSIGHQLTSAGDVFNSIITTKKSAGTLTNSKVSQEHLELFYVLVIKYIIKSFVHPFLGAKTALHPDLENAELDFLRMKNIMKYYYRVANYFPYFFRAYFSTPYLYDTFIIEMRAHLKLVKKILLINTLDLTELSLLLEEVVTKWDSDIHRFFNDKKVGELIAYQYAGKIGPQSFFPELEKYQAQAKAQLDPVSQDKLLSERFTKYIIQFSRIIHKTPYTLVDPSQNLSLPVEEPDMQCPTCDVITESPKMIVLDSGGSVTNQVATLEPGPEENLEV